MLALTSCTGKLGGAVLNAILEHNILPTNDLVICTSSNTEDPRWEKLKSKGVQVRQMNYDDPALMLNAFQGCTKAFIVSTPRISMDFNNAPPGTGREKHHVAAIEAARAAGVKHIYYTSLGFGSNSKANVMRAHNRTEAFLYGLTDTKYTVIREGLYNESWPLYLGHYDLKKDGDRKEIVVAGDGLISWTSIADLGFATALVLGDPSDKYVGKTFYLSAPTSRTLKDVAKTVSEVKGMEVSVKLVSREEHVRYYVEERGMDRPYVEWWSTTYDALKDGECDIKDATLSDLFASKGRKAQPVEETTTAMLKGQ